MRHCPMSVMAIMAIMVTMEAIVRTMVDTGTGTNLLSRFRFAAEDGANLIRIPVDAISGA